MTATEQPHELTWGAIMLAEPGADDLADLPYQFYALGTTELGNPVPLVEMLKSTLSDGSVYVSHGHDSRTFPIQIAVTADDGEQLAVAESVLLAEALAEQPGNLRWVPPAVESAPCNLVVQGADVQRGYPDLWDLHEAKRLTRFFTINMTTKPWVQPDEPVVVEAIPLPPDAPPEWTDVDDCTSTTGWARETNGGASGTTGPLIPLPGHSVQVGAFISGPGKFLRLVRTGSIAVPTDYYLAVDIEIHKSYLTRGSWSAYYNGGWHSPVAVVPGAGEDNSTRVFFANVGTVSSLKLSFDYTVVPSGDEVVLEVYNVAHTDRLVFSTATAREQVRTLEVLGSAPTTAGLRLFTDTSDLGKQALIYTATDAAVFVPPLRKWLDSSAAVTADTDLISGARNDLSADMVFLIPASLVLSGTYALVAQMRRNAAGTIRTIDWSARVVDDAGADVFGSDVVTSGSIDLTMPDTSWHLYALAAPTLPPLALDDGAGYAVELTLSVASAGDEVLVDEAMLLDTDRGGYTMVDLPSTADLSWIEVRSADIDAPKPAVFGGTGGSDFEAGQDIGRFAKGGIHRFTPGTMLEFTAVSGSTESQSNIRFYPLFGWHVIYGALET